MQKKIIALAIAGLASTAAFAQSNVTIYGIADVSMSGTTYLGNTARQTQYNVNSGTLSTSRIGFKGVEDLGNGLKALFVLEYGLGMDVSQGIGYSTTASAAARQQFVGLTGGFGTAVAGHLQTTGLDFTVAGSALGASTGLGVAHSGAGLQASSATHLISALLGGRQDNAVAYISPSFGGVTVAYNHARVTECAGTVPAASNSCVAGQLGNTDAHGDLLSASYENGPVTAGAIATRVTVIGANNNVTEYGLRAGYDFGVVKLQTQYQRAKAEAKTVAGLGADSLWLVSATVPVGAKLALIAEYAHTSVKSTLAADNVQAATVAATYALSKRTTAYAGVAAKRTANDATVATYVPDTNTYAVGLRHMF